MKPLTLSLTFWINLIAIVIEVIQFLVGQNIIPSGVAVVIVGILNILVRWFKTRTAISGIFSSSK